jgi:selT/selW/selH-like putative selenoprotein
MEFKILYCGPCGYHGRGEELADELRDRFAAQVTVEEGGFGQFDVFLNGKLVASKGGFFKRILIHGAPPQDQMLASRDRTRPCRSGRRRLRAHQRRPNPYDHFETVLNRFR